MPPSPPTAMRAAHHPFAHQPILAFDLDGTLTNPAEGITRCIAHALEELGRTPPPLEALAWCIGPPLRVSFPLLLQAESGAPPDDGDLVERAVALYRNRFRTIGMFENHVYDGVPDMLHSIAASVAAVERGRRRLVVATSKPQVFAERILDHFGLARYFERVFGSQLDGRHDDKGDLLAHLLAELDADPRDVVMIGDREHDILAARRHGMRSIGVTYGFGTGEELLAAGADALAASPEALASMLAAPTARSAV